MTSRLRQLRAQFDALKIDGFLVTLPPHVRYLSGFSGSAGVGIVTRSALTLLTDGRYAEQVRSEVQGWKIIVTQRGLFEEIQHKRLLAPGARIGFDGNSVSFAQFQHLRKLLPKVKFLPKVDCVERIAVTKDAGEVAKIRRAVAISDAVFAELLPLVKPGVAELDLAAEISYRHRRHGAEGDAFETIVASGERSALPHGRATAKKLKTGELVTFDFGCVYEGYHSDITRTVALGKPKAEARKIYRVVLEAQERSVEAATAGMPASELDSVARAHIKRQGYEKYFRHSLGHGIGLQIHEQPRISVLSKATLERGNVITIEPGIYLPGVGGVRIEDDVVISEGRCEVLTRSTKELLVL
jgi:Xaa-Pro aminopeptidase